MRITFFQESLDDSANERSRQVREYVKRMPESDLDAGEADQVCELIVAKFRFPEMPEFAAGPVERDEPVFTQGSNQVSMTVYFPYKGDPSLFRLYYGSRPLSPPPPSFEVGDGVLIKTYVLEKQRIEDLDHQVDAEIRTVEEYTKQLKYMIVLFNKSLLDKTREAIRARSHEVNQNKQAAAKVSQQSRLTVRKRQDGTEQVVVPVHAS